MRNRIVYCFLVVLLFSSCSITPRYHSFGYNVEWKTRGTSRSKTTAAARSAESHGPVARPCKDESFIKQESRATADIFSSSASNYFSLNHSHVGKQKESQPNLSLYSLHNPTRIVWSKTKDTTPIKVVKPNTKEVLTIVEPPGIEVLDRKINISNWLIVLSHGPMIYLFWRMIHIPIIDFLDFFIFFALMGLASIPILIALIHRFELGRKRRSLYYRENIQNKEAAQLLSRLYSRSVVYLFFAGNIILGLLILIEKLKMKKLLNKINRLEPNNPFVLREIEKIELFYDIALVIFYLTAGLFILPYFI